MNYDIFISYRRTDSEGNISGRDIARLLSKEFKIFGYKTFFDYSELKDYDFAQTIIPAVQNCKIFILVLTKDSLLRCKNRNDWVRREITEAINSNVKIITVNPDNQFNGWPDDLPSELNSIKTIQISSIDMNSNFEITMKHLIDTRISNVVKPSLHLDRKDDKNDKEISFAIEDRIFSIPDEIFNDALYKALKRSYAK